MKNVDHVLIIGFGGPTKREEILPFLRQVAKGRNIPEARLKEVEHHYKRVGGFSPYNAYAFQLAEKLKAALQVESEPAAIQASDGRSTNQPRTKRTGVPVFVGMRNWHPFFQETLAVIKALGLKQGVGVILAPHRCETSYERYIQDVDEARRTVGAGGWPAPARPSGGWPPEQAGAEEINYQYLKPWHTHPLFIQAQVDEARKILDSLSSDAQKETHILFSAHSIPLDMPGCAGYQEEIRQSSALVAAELGAQDWTLAYQSRSGGGRPWTEPDVVSVIKSLAEKGKKRVLIVPIGFLCDNVELLFDLDVTAKEEAEKCGLQYIRAKTIADNPRLVAMLQSLILEYFPASHPA